MSKQIEMQWEMLCTDEEWDEVNEVKQPPVSTDSPRKKYTAHTLLLAAALACMLIVSLWSDNAPIKEKTSPKTAAVVYSQPATSVRQGIDPPHAPLEYWEEKFFTEEVLGREFTKTPRQYWEDKFFQQEIEGR